MEWNGIGKRGYIHFYHAKVDDENERKKGSEKKINPENTVQFIKQFLFRTTNYTLTHSE